MPGPLTESELRSALADAHDGAAERLRRPLSVPPNEAKPDEGSAMPASMRLTFTINEAAESLGISRGSVYEGIRSGRFPVVRLGRRTLIPVEGLRRWVTEQTRFEGR